MDTHTPPRVAAAAVAPEYIGIADAAVIVGCSALTIRRRIADGSLPASRLGKSNTVRIAVADVHAMLRPIPAAGGHRA